MRRRLVLGTLGVVLAVLALLEIPLAVIYVRREHDALDTALQRDAAVFAAVSGEIIEGPGNHDVNRLARRFSSEPGETAVVVDKNGTHLTAPTALERDGAFEQILARARAGVISHGERKGFRYVAVPLGDSDDRLGAVLVARADARVDAHVHRFWAILVGLAAAVVGVALFLTRRFSHWVVDPLRRLDEQAAALGSGDLGARATTEIGPEEVVTLARTFNAMADRLDDLVTSQRRFVADASHQLRTPLTALRLRLENLDPADAAGFVATREAALSEATRLSRLVDGLLSLARAEGFRVDRTEVNVSAVVAERHDAWAPLAAEREVDLSVEQHGPELIADLGVGQLEQILDNLIDNALEASPAGRKLTLRSAAHGSTVEIHVIDEGRGMADDERARAFDPFWQSAAPRPERGTGLGLAIAAELARANNGTITLERSAAGGVDAVVCFPAARNGGRGSE